MHNAFKSIILLDRSLKEEELKVTITRAHKNSYPFYGTGKLWSDLKGEGPDIIGCAIHGLSRYSLGTTGRADITSTIFIELQERPKDLVKRTFAALALHMLNASITKVAWQNFDPVEI